MEIKNLSQLKKAIAAGNPFIIRKHYVRPEFEGQIRVASVVQTNGFYSVVKDQPDAAVSQFNNQRGSWLSYGKASDWVFENGLCKLFDRRTNGSGAQRPVWEIEFL